MLTASKQTTGLKPSALKTALLALAVSCSLSLTGCGEPLSDLDKKVLRAEKDLKRSQKELAKMKRRNPQLFVVDGRSEKQQIEMLIRSKDWKTVKSVYERLADLELDLGDYPADLEARLVEIVSAMPAAQLENNHLGYSFLATINPSHTIYQEKANTYKSKLMAQAEAAVSRLKTNHDKIEDIHWYHHPKEPTSTSVYFYIGKRPGGQPWLRLRGRYTSKHGWLFVNKITAWTDGETSGFLNGPFERRNTSRVWEWQDLTPSPSQVSTMRSLGHANESILRFEGENRNFDLTLTKQNKKGILEVLEAYEALQTFERYNSVEKQ